MFWIALELSIPKIGLNIMLYATVKKLDAFKFDGVAESNNTAYFILGVSREMQKAPTLTCALACRRFCWDKRLDWVDHKMNICILQNWEQFIAETHPFFRFLNSCCLVDVFNKRIFFSIAAKNVTDAQIKEQIYLGFLVVFRPLRHYRRIAFVCRKAIRQIAPGAQACKSNTFVENIFFPSIPQFNRYSLWNSFCTDASVCYHKANKSLQ